jgi:glycosyltransferase involved in cell wall biosynthesis
MRKTPLVSIGLPVHNGELYLRESVDSLLAQTFTDFELLLSDNASTDGTATICQEYAARDRRVRYIRNETNIGLNRNCNQVVRRSAGKYFKLAASDDVCHPELVNQCVKVLEDNPAVVLAYGKTRFIDPDGICLALTDPGWHMMSDSPADRLRRVITSGHWVNTFFGLARMADLTRTRLFAPYVSGDYRLLAELSLRGKFFEVPEFTFFRRLHPEASSQNKDANWQSDYFRSRGRLPFWSLSLDYMSIILSSELAPSRKLRCLELVVTRMVRGRRSLINEILSASRHYAKAFSTRTVFRRTN